MADGCFGGAAVVDGVVDGDTDACPLVVTAGCPVVVGDATVDRVVVGDAAGGRVVAVAGRSAGGSVTMAGSVSTRSAITAIGSSSRRRLLRSPTGSAQVRTRLRLQPAGCVAAHVSTESGKARLPPTRTSTATRNDRPARPRALGHCLLTGRRCYTVATQTTEMLRTCFGGIHARSVQRSLSLNQTDSTGSMTIRRLTTKRGTST